MLEKLLSYIPYFENANSTATWEKPEVQESGVFHMAYSIYDETFLDFIDEFYKTDLVIGDYLSIIEKKVQDKNFKAVIPEADMELVLAILTFLVRSERFCDGAWVGAIKRKEFLLVLRRVRELVLSN